MPTSSSSSRARCRACSGRMRRWRRRASMIWSPTGRVGLRLAMGSWKSMAACGPRTARICRSLQGTMSRPSSRMRPEMRALSGSRRRMERQSTDLPQPDSPTMARVSPACSSRSTPRTACTCPAGVAKVMCRSSSCSRGVMAGAGLRLEKGGRTLYGAGTAAAPASFPGGPSGRCGASGSGQGAAGRQTTGAPRPACGRRHPRQKHLPAASSVAGSSLRCST